MESKSARRIKFPVIPALHFIHYNFIRRQMTLRMPPALKAGVTDHMWTMEELVAMIEAYEAKMKNPIN